MKILFIFFLIIIPQAAAAGIGVSPSKLEFEEPGEKIIHLFNLGKEPAEFQLIATKGLSIFPSKGKIIDKVEISIKANQCCAGEGEIRAYFLKDEGVVLGAGIPVYRSFSEDNTHFFRGILLSSSIIIIGLAAYLIIARS